MKNVRRSAYFCFTTVIVGANLVQAQTWTFTGNMNDQRMNHTTTQLQSGEVLVAGGRSINSPYLNTAELYDPSTGKFTYTGNLNTERGQHAAVLLPNGEVLIAGGIHKVGVYLNCLSSAELYNPSTGSFTFTGSLTTALCSPTAMLLNNDKVLILGGPTAELYDPSTGTFSVSGSPNVSRAQYTATLLPSGEVLVAGGWVGPNYNTLTASAELYNPATGTFTLTGSLHTTRYRHTATLLNNGEVLIADGGTFVGPMFEALNTAELYNPSTGKFTVTGSTNGYRFDHLAALLPSGEVLLADGYATIGAELYDPSTGTFKVTASPNVARAAGAGIVLLRDGDVLVTGGAIVRSNHPYPQNSAELYR